MREPRLPLSGSERSTELMGPSSTKPAPELAEHTDLSLRGGRRRQDPLARIVCASPVACARLYCPWLGKKRSASLSLGPQKRITEPHQAPRNPTGGSRPGVLGLPSGVHQPRPVGFPASAAGRGYVQSLRRSRRRGKCLPPTAICVPRTATSAVVFSGGCAIGLSAVASADRLFSRQGAGSMLRSPRLVPRFELGCPRRAVANVTWRLSTTGA